MPLTLRLSPKAIAILLASIAVYLALQSITGRIIQTRLGDDSPGLLDDFVSIVNVNREESVPAWYSSMLLLSCSLALALIAHYKHVQRQPYARHWLALALIFLYMSADETAAIHEYLSEPLGETLNTTGPLYFAWVIVGFLAVVVFALAYFRFWLRLERRWRVLFLVAGMVYVGGALGIELFGAEEWEREGGSLRYSAIGTIEELCEMLGAVIFLYGLLTYLAHYVGEMQVRFGVAPSPDEPPEGDPAS